MGMPAKREGNAAIDEFEPLVRLMSQEERSFSFVTARERTAERTRRIPSSPVVLDAAKPYRRTSTLDPQTIVSKCPNACPLEGTGNSVGADLVVVIPQNREYALLSPKTR